MEEITFDNETHTLGSLLQQELLNFKDVTFSGYIVSHPLEKNFKLKIQVNESLKQSKKPREFLNDAINNVLEKLNILEDELNE